ncbi:hypothetical protein RND81_11G037500 [Saponaria officinalis]|uniref:Ran guanine nucleotide release factor n=1 Tax=Saponaria officinalis TaxID=3572 RepID=A0AAW1HI08_SAPOF
MLSDSSSTDSSSTSDSSNSHDYYNQSRIDFNQWCFRNFEDDRLIDRMLEDTLMFHATQIIQQSISTRTSRSQNRQLNHQFSDDRPLFGGAISMTFPLRFQDVSDVRQVPDYQEAFADSIRDESIIVELLDFEHDVADDASAVWFLQDLAREQNAESGMVIGQSEVLQAPDLCYLSTPVVVTSATGQMVISKGSEDREARNTVKVYLANLRLKEVGTDVLITAYEPININRLSENAGRVDSRAISPEPSGCTSIAEVFKLCVSSFKVNDWRLFQA